MPATLRMAGGGSIGFGAQHSQCVENWFLNIPGLKLCLPATPADAYTLLRAAIRDDDPVLVFEHKALYGRHRRARRPRTPAPDRARPRSCAPGADVTVVATQLMRHRTLEAAEELADGGHRRSR